MRMIRKESRVLNLAFRMGNSLHVKGSAISCADFLLVLNEAVVRPFFGSREIAGPMSYALGRPVEV